MLVISPKIPVLQATADKMQRRLELEIFDIGAQLSNALIEHPKRNYPRIARQWLTDTLREKAPGPIVCLGIDLLFEPIVQLDPLALLKEISRITRLIILWPGTYTGEVLSYATPEHFHYRTWRKPEVAIYKPETGVLSY
jgi:hypothetical protein